LNFEGQAVMAHPYYPPQVAYNDANGISTIFISGLPDDVKPREIHNLFRYRPGFDYCQLKYTGRGNQVVAFATFVNHQSAMAALHTLQGAKFDPQTGATLHIELARSNSRRKMKPGAEAYVVIDKRNKALNPTQTESSDDGDSEPDEPHEQNNYVLGNNVDIGVPKSMEGAVDAGNAVAAENDGLRPCSTLFIANLGPNCTDEELKTAFSQYPGFKSTKRRDRGGMPVAFADYEEVEQATEAMNTLQGSLLASSDRGGMHIEYARSKMRKH
jgi:hypothetical protein